MSRTQSMLDKLTNDPALTESIEKTTHLTYDCLNNKRKLMFIGNGGSAADAQHMSAEYVSRFMFDRPGLASLALTTDTSALTAIGNDYGFDKLFSRQIEALGQEGDLLFAYSTSGTSSNIVSALKEAKKANIKTIGMTGIKPQSNTMVDLCDITIRIPSLETAHIQEGHLIVGHIICHAVERLMFPNQAPHITK